MISPEHVQQIRLFASNSRLDNTSREAGCWHVRPNGDCMLPWGTSQEGQLQPQHWAPCLHNSRPLVQVDSSQPAEEVVSKHQHSECLSDWNNMFSWVVQLIEIPRAKTWSANQIKLRCPRNDHQHDDRVLYRVLPMMMMMVPGVLLFGIRRRRSRDLGNRASFLLLECVLLIGLPADCHAQKTRGQDDDDHHRRSWMTMTVEARISDGGMAGWMYRR